MELDMFSIRQILSYCREINHTVNHSDSHHQKSRATKNVLTKDIVKLKRSYRYTFE